jgi:hypothetical protein
MADLETTYTEVAFGLDEPDVMCCTAGHAREHFSADIDPAITDDVMLLFTSEGYEVME